MVRVGLNDGNALVLVFLFGFVSEVLPLPKRSGYRMNELYFGGSVGFL